VRSSYKLTERQPDKKKEIYLLIVSPRPVCIILSTRRVSALMSMKARSWARGVQTAQSQGSRGILLTSSGSQRRSDCICDSSSSNNICCSNSHGLLLVLLPSSVFVQQLFELSNSYLEGIIARISCGLSQSHLEFFESELDNGSGSLLLIYSPKKKFRRRVIRV
jgi:hypothetical protein